MTSKLIGQTRQNAMFFGAVLAISAAGLLPEPSTAQALPIIPLAPACSFVGTLKLDQSNGFRVEVPVTGGTSISGTATAFGSNSKAFARGTATGGIKDDKVDFTIDWDGPSKGKYTGTADSAGVIEGDTEDTGQPGSPNATWTSDTPLTCVAAPPPKPAPGGTAPGAPGGSGPSARVGTNVDASELNSLINDARLHPEKYPPNGDSTGANMVACPKPFQISGALAGTARVHNSFLASKPLNDANAAPHLTADGTLAFNSGGPIDRAGFHSAQAEIVAIGQSTAAGALEFWMQNDAAFGWGHRNLILTCAINQAGGAHLRGGPGGNYWTVDMGNP